MSSTLDLSTDPRWIAVKRILSSKQFRNAEKQSAFLNYVIERAIEGRTGEISEQQIGMHVFSRPSGYDAGSDTVVRSAARQLRQRLAVYYMEEGEAESIRISIPTGSYVPAFLRRPEPPAGAEEDGKAETPGLENVSVAKAPKLRFVLAISAAALLVLAAIAYFKPLPPSTFDRFWLTMLPPGERMLFVPTDSGIVMFQNYLQRNLSLPEYADGSYTAGWTGSKHNTRDKPEFFFGLRRYTSIADLRMFASLVRVPAMDPNRIEIRFPRDLTTSDFKRGNVFLAGGPQGNPWVQLFEPSLNFSISTDDELGIQTVVNKKPLASEKLPWTAYFRDPGHDVFSLIAYLPNLDKSGHVLVISGSTMAGIDAAGDFLTNSRAMTPVAEKMRNADGSFKSFELVLKTESIRSGALSSNIVAMRP